MVGQDPRELLAQFEKRWRDELARVSLVAELEFTRQETNTALFCIGRVWKSEYSAQRAATRIKASYPASFVVAVAGSASVKLVGGKVLPPIFEAAGLKDDGNLGRIFGRTFISCLDSLDLPTFPELDNEAAYRYAGRMLLHGGVPLDHLDEWFEVAEGARRRLGDISRQALQAWMVERADEGRLYGATRTIERFLRYGEEFAADFLDRSLDLLDRVREGDGIDDLNVGLARRYLERAIELRETGQLPGVGKRERRRGQVAARPEVRFDPYVLGVHLVLPPVVDDSGTATWLVDLEGRIERIAVRASRPGLPTPEAEVLLPSTVGHVEVSRAGEEAISIKVTDLDDPHLVFDSAGRKVERTGRLPRDTAWSVHPATRNLQDAADRPLRVVESHEAIPRWHGWTARLIDLRSVDRLLLEGGRAYAVSTDESAQLVQVDDVPHVRTETGLEVLRAWPALRLPGRAAGATWQVSVASLNGAGPSLSRTIEVGSEAVEVDLAEVAAESLDWQSVRVRARGPLGRSLRTDFFIAPDLTLSVVPSVRTLEEAGLSATKVELARGTEEVASFVLEPAERARSVSIHKAVLVIEPAAVAVEYIGERSTGWRFRPLVLDADEIESSAGSLVVRLPGADFVTLTVLDGTGHELQSIAPDGRGRPDGARRFDLARLTDTLRAHGSLVLVVASDVWRGRVATVQPARLAADVVVYPERGIIEFQDVRTEGVRAALYVRSAPTREPLLLDVPRGDHQVDLPQDLVGVGALRVMLRIEDPWVPLPWPRFPGPELNVFDLDDLPIDLAVLEAAHPLAPYLAGEAELGSVNTIGDALRIYGLADILRTRRPPSSIRYDLADPLVDYPEDTLVAALDAEFDGRELASVMVASGLVASRVRHPVDLDRVEALWTRWPGAGLVGLGDLEDEATTRFVVSRCGPAAEALLNGQGCEALAQPRMDEPRVLDFDPTVLAMLRSEAGIVPRYLLDADTRADDGFELIRALQDDATHAALAQSIREAESLVRYFLDQVLPAVGLPALQEGIRARIQGEGWQILPAASLAAATAARLAPRATGRVMVYTRQVRTTLDALVAVAPRLVAADLVLAELAIQGASQ